MRVALIHNPGAGDRESGEMLHLTRLIAAEGHEVTREVYDADEWDEALASPVDVVVVAGGDGTVGKVARRLAGRRVPLSFLPVGTANNIARTFGVADMALDDVVRGWRSPTTYDVDVGYIDGPWGARRFVEAVGAGLFARTMAAMDAADALSHIDDPDEKLARTFEVLAGRLERLRPTTMKLTVDGRDLSGDYLMLEVMNLRFVGPNLCVAPRSDPFDGWLDVTPVPESRRDELLRYLDAGWRESACAPDLGSVRAKEVTLEGAGFVLHVDDEAWPPEGAAVPEGGARFEVRVEPGALKVMVPEGAAGGVFGR